MADMGIPQVQVPEFYHKKYGVKKVSQELVIDVQGYILAAVRGAIIDYCDKNKILEADFMAKLKDSVDLRTELRPYVAAQLRYFKLIGGRFIKSLYKYDRSMFDKLVKDATDVTISMREKDNWVEGAYRIAENNVCYAKSKRPVFYNNFCDGFYTYKYKDKFLMDSTFRKHKRGQNKGRIQRAKASLKEVGEHFGYVMSRRKKGAAPRIKTETPPANVPKAKVKNGGIMAKILKAKAPRANVKSASVIAWILRLFKIIK